MNEKTKIIPIRDVEDWQVERLFYAKAYEDRCTARQRRHRLARQWIDAALVAAAFLAGIAVGLVAGVL